MILAEGQHGINLLGEMKHLEFLDGKWLKLVRFQVAEIVEHWLWNSLDNKEFVGTLN